jgi:two-component system cell cycle response regulator DivK
VLIVDDDERNVRLGSDVLESAGFTTATAATAAEGIESALHRRPDVVLMDLRLPDLDGSEAMRRLAADARTARIPVVATSALPAAEAAPHALEAGFAGYIEKPIDVVAFPAQVGAFAARSR